MRMPKLGILGRWTYRGLRSTVMLDRSHTEPWRGSGL